MKKLVWLLPVLLLSGCINADKASSVLTKQGYTDIKIRGYGWFDCSEDDLFKTKFSAKAPNGEDVSGSVCGGWFKGNTVRLD